MDYESVGFASIIIHVFAEEFGLFCKEVSPTLVSFLLMKVFMKLVKTYDDGNG